MHDYDINELLDLNCSNHGSRDRGSGPKVGLIWTLIHFQKNLKFYSQISLRKNKCKIMIYGPWVRVQRLWLRQYGHIVNLY